MRLIQVLKAKAYLELGVEMRIPEIVIITDQIEREFHEWAVMQ